MVKEMKNAFDGLISRLDTAEETISELEDIATETSKTEKERKQKLKRTEYPRTVGQLQKMQHTHNMSIRKREEQKKYLKQ